MTSEELSKKILSDIEIIKSNRELIQAKMNRVSISKELKMELLQVLNYFRDSNFEFLLNVRDMNNLYKFEKIFEPFCNIIKVITKSSISPSNTEVKHLEEAAHEVYKYIQGLLDEKNHTTQEEDSSVILGRGINVSEKIDDLLTRIENLENKPEEIIDTLKKTLGDAEYSSRNVKEFADKIESSYSDTSNYIEKIKNELDDIMVKSNETLNHNISMVLTEQLQDKATKLKEEALQKLGNISWNPLKILGFYGAIEIALVVNVTIWIVYFIMTCFVSLDFLHFMIFKLTINIPLLVYVAFTLNEYTKAKKLYEEFDYKRIMAQTLMNNFALFKQELLGNDTSVSSNEKLLNLIKTPLEKIFDNPVHSIYGDKSGDKNIGLEQLEKFASIFEKLKKQN
jgi:hypothetical protein